MGYSKIEDYEQEHEQEPDFKPRRWVRFDLTTRLGKVERTIALTRQTERCE
jgi:hypothetical protein